MVFTQANIKNATVGKRSGERLAEQKIKHEIREADDNLFKKGFIVDVNIELRGGKPVAYRVTNLHDVIDLPDDG